MEFLNCATFKGLINDTFKVRLEGPVPRQEGMAASPTELEFRLAEAEEQTDDRLERFSLIFQGPPQLLLPQKLYSLIHDTLGEQKIFLVPVGEITEGEGEGRKVIGYKYQAVFNRFKNNQ